MITHGAGSLFTWLFPGLQFIDYNEEVLIHESFAIASISPAFTYAVLREMPFDSYEMVVSQAKKMSEKTANSGEQLE